MRELELSSAGDPQIANRYSQAVRAFEAGRLSRAHTEFSKLADVPEYFERCANALVQIDLQRGEEDKCLATLARLIEHSPDNSAYRLSFAALAKTTEQQLQGLEWLRSFNRSQPDNAEVRAQTAQTLRALGRRRQALQEFSAALELGAPNPQDILVSQAIVHADLGEHVQGVALLDRALAIEPGFFPALFNRASLLEELGERKAATDAWRAVLALYPDALEARARLAEAMAPTAESLAQLDQLAAAHTSAEDTVVLAFAQGRLADQLGRYEEAFSHFRRGNGAQQRQQSEYDPTAASARVDALIATFTPQWFAAHTLQRSEAPGFICGMFRSGSTLLEHQLAQHSDLEAGGELDFFQHAQRRFPRFPEVPIHPDDLNTLADDYCALLASFADPEGVTRLNKRPDNLQQVGLIKTLFPAARIVITRRAKAENCLSVFSHALGAGQAYATNLRHSAHHYLQMQRLAEHWAQVFPDSVTVVDYEALVADPGAVLQGVYERLGLEPDNRDSDDASMEASGRRTRPARTASVWQVREPIYATSVARARAYQPWLAEIGSLD